MTLRRKSVHFVKYDNLLSYLYSNGGVIMVPSSAMVKQYTRKRKLMYHGDPFNDANWDILMENIDLLAIMVNCPDLSKVNREDFIKLISPKP